jgi:ATP-dependent DNA helicase RecQ
VGATDPTAEPAPPDLEAARDLLRRVFGHADLRPGQDEAVARVLSGEDLTIVMPTGAGKSACFQLPALLRPGLTLVVSPLIALMKDQVEALQARGVAADLVNSTVPAAEQWRRLDAAASGRAKLLYVAPERLAAPSFRRAMDRTRVDLVAVDEAHCISQWGHDFRPAYLTIAEFLSTLRKGPEARRPQVVALTATATPRVRADIAEQLGLDPERILVTGFHRPELRLLARRCDAKTARVEQVLRIARGVGGSGIVYCGTRKDVEEVADALGAAGLGVVAYHAGLDDAARTQAQDAFLLGRTPVIVATNAFGMGIDKPDIRFVVHHALPGSVEAYYQEAGRAGRDGKTSYCVLLHGAADRHLHEFFVEGSNPPDPAVHAVLAALRRVPGDVLTMPHEDLAEAAGVPEIQVGGALRILEDAGLVERLDDRDNPAHVRLLGAPTQLLERLPPGTQRRALLDWIVVRLGATAGGVVAVAPGLVESDLGLARETLLRVLRELAEAGVADVRPPARGRGIVVTGRSLAVPEVRRRLAPQLERAAARRDRAMERLDKVEHYARARSCRHAFLLRYFGDARRVECRSCDNCCGWHAAEPASGRSAASPPLLRARAGRGSAGVDLDGVRPLALRAVADLRGRYGLGMAKLVLRGSRARKVLSARLDASPAYGVLARLREEQVEGVLDALETEGLVETTGGPYPLASLTEEGRMRLQA